MHICHCILVSSCPIYSYRCCLYRTSTVHITCPNKCMFMQDTATVKKVHSMHLCQLLLEVSMSCTCVSIKGSGMRCFPSAAICTVPYSLNLYMYILCTELRYDHA